MRLNVIVPNKLVEEFDKVYPDYYGKRSEAIRDLMRRFIRAHKETLEKLVRDIERQEKETRRRKPRK